MTPSSEHRSIDPLPLPFHGKTQQPDTDPLPLPFHGKPIAIDPTTPISTLLSFHSSPAHGPSTMSVGNAADPAYRDRPKGIIL